MPYNKVWFYVNSRVEEDGVLPSFTEIFDKFECDNDVIEDAVKAVVRCTRMDGVKIEWRGELDGLSCRGIASELEISHKTA